MWRTTKTKLHFIAIIVHWWFKVHTFSMLSRELQPVCVARFIWLALLIKCVCTFWQWSHSERAWKSLLVYLCAWQNAFHCTVASPLMCMRALCAEHKNKWCKTLKSLCINHCIAIYLMKFPLAYSIDLFVQVAYFVLSSFPPSLFLVVAYTHLRGTHLMHFDSNGGGSGFVWVKKRTK